MDVIREPGESGRNLIATISPPDGRSRQGDLKHR
jgi:hypothetical protein